MKVIYLALAANAHGHEVHKTAQVESWANSLGNDSRVIWMYGDSSLHQARLIGNDLYLPVEEIYENILEKTILGVNWVLDNLDFDYLIRTNTSNFFVDYLVRKHLTQMTPSELIFAGVKAKWKGRIKGSRRFHKYISGSGIYMNRKTAEMLANLPLGEYREVPDDVAIGHYLYSKGTKSYSIPRNDITDFKPLKLLPQIRVKSWKQDDLTATRMKEIDAIFFVGDAKNGRIELKEFVSNEIKRASIEKPRRRLALRYQYKLNTPSLYLALRKTPRLPRTD